MKSTEGSADLIRSGENDKLAKLIRDDPSLARRPAGQGIGLLQYAAYCGNEGAIRILREHRHEPDLFEAASTGDADRVRQLVDRDPDMVNHYSPDGFTPLGLAELLFKNGADAKAKTDDGRTPPDMAGEAGHNQTPELINKHL